MVRSEHVRTLFDSTQSQKSKSEVGVRNRTRQCALGPILIMRPFCIYIISGIQIVNEYCAAMHIKILYIRSMLSETELVIAESKLVLKIAKLQSFKRCVASGIYTKISRRLSPPKESRRLQVL